MTADGNSIDWNSVVDILSGVALTFGALLSLGAAVGMVRFPDLMSRMHAASKPQVLGLLLVLVALGLQMRSWVVWPVLLLAWLFQLLTVPISAHMVSRAGYRTKHRHPELLTEDDLAAVVSQAAEERKTQD
ncbi:MULTISPECIES: monovalent cation/H(+) antiporter subunit G [Arthrobacter]|uniref:Multisubunit sodium/proton antiporter, MrpG subunit n=1 Tax=Arthrobacter woluwensis TaxID=156980 RepID=A0A1H4KH00_9MICC|nr:MULTISPECIES: monovalent cation/H(+) antiporter subunit G [Arthrobacter]PSS44275.1 Na+/H+ antiporter subunit G [Arthrobacter woluwensis]QTF72823.1 monovalent cation/H(+) antiporter subunit G [Arthrobacter woluwensis]SEB57791.1 multisubunit sodium/proton antiporter, MrpG subunit [Arthrobacter woluwensis]